MSADDDIQPIATAENNGTPSTAIENNTEQDSVEKNIDTLEAQSNESGRKETIPTLDEANVYFEKTYTRMLQEQGLTIHSDSEPNLTGTNEEPHTSDLRGILPASNSDYQEILRTQFSNQQSQIQSQQIQIQQLIQLVTQMSQTTQTSLVPQHTPVVQPTFALPTLEKLLPHFNGGETENPVKFIDELKRIYETYKVPKSTWKITVRNQLSNSAKTWFDRNSDRFEHLEDFEEKFLAHYNSEQICTSLKANFYGITHQLNTNAEEFVNNKLKLHVRIFPRATEAERIADVLHLLHPRVKIHLMESPKTVEDLLKILRIFDQAWSTDGQKEAPKPIKNFTPQTSNQYQPRNPDTSNAYRQNNHSKFPRYQPRYPPVENAKALEKTEPSSQEKQQNEPQASSNCKNQNNHIKLEGEKSRTFPYVSLKFNDRHVPGYVDTLANACFIDEALLPTGVNLLETKDGVVLADKTSAHPLGKIKANFEIGNTGFEHDFFVMQHLNLPMILGYDWLKDNGVVIDLMSDCLRLGTENRETIALVKGNSNPNVNPIENISDKEMNVEFAPPLADNEDVASVIQLQLLQVENKLDLEDEVKEAQLEDDKVAEIGAEYESILHKPTDKLVDKEVKMLQKYQVINTHLYYRPKSSEDWKLVVPEKMKEKILRYYHDNPIYCHPGIQATYTLINQYFNWPNCLADISNHIRQCEDCARVKVAGRTKAAPLRPRTELEKLEVWSIDIMGPYTASRKHKNRYLITATDPCSKWVEAKAVRHVDSEAIIKFLETDIFSRFGYPKKVISDQGSQFVSSKFEEFCENHGIKHYTTAAYTPRQNPVERKNQNIKNKLRLHLLDKDHNQWDENLPNILFSIRSSRNSATNHSPAEVLFNQNLKAPLEQHYPHSNSSDIGKNSKHKSAILHQQKFHNRHYQPNKKLKPYPVNAIVFIRNHQLSNLHQGIVASLLPKWIGPYVITKVYESGVYVCQNKSDPKDIRKVAHQDIQLRPKQTEELSDTDTLSTTSSTGSSSTYSTQSSSYVPIQHYHNSSHSLDANTSYPTQILNPNYHKRQRKKNPKYFGNSWVTSY